MANRLGGRAFEVPGTIEIDVVLDHDGSLQRALGVGTGARPRPVGSDARLIIAIASGPEAAGHAELWFTSRR